MQNLGWGEDLQGGQYSMSQGLPWDGDGLKLAEQAARCKQRQITQPTWSHWHEREPLVACRQVPLPLQFSGQSNLLMVMVYLQSEWSSPSTPAYHVPTDVNSTSCTAWLAAASADS